MFTLPVEIQEGQFKIIQTLTRYLTPARAEDAIKGSAIPRLMKAFNYHAATYQMYIAEFLESIIEKGRKVLDIPTVISMVLCPYPAVQNIGTKTLASMSDSAGEGQKNLDSEFENHIPFLFEAYQSTKNSSPEYRRHLITTLANLAGRDYLRPIIIDHKGIQMFLAGLRDD